MITLKVGMILALIFAGFLFFLMKLLKRERKALEDKLTNNIVKVLEKMEGNKNARTKK